MTSIKLSTEDLAAELARREQEEAATAQATAAALQAAQDAYDQRILTDYTSTDTSLTDQAQDAMTAARAALSSGDLPAAYAGYHKWHVARAARAALAELRNNAATRQNHHIEQVHVPRAVDVTFDAWIQLEAPPLIHAAGHDAIEAHFGEFPTSIN